MSSGASVQKVAIVGGGVGGLATALALRHAGIEATVYEQAAELRHIQTGGGIHIWPNAIKALRQIDLGDQVQAIGMEVEYLRFRSSKGKPLGRLDVGPATRRLGANVIGTRRAFLHKALADALGPEAVAVGAKFTGFEQDGEGVTLRFADGREERADLLVGADGVTSAVRQQIHGPNKPQYAGYTSWIAHAEFDHEDTPERTLTVSFGPGGRFIFYHVAPGRLGWIGNYNEPEGQRDEGGSKAVVLDRFGAWSGPIRPLVEATDEETIVRTDLVDKPPIKQWTQGRVTLLGDAAHPITPNIAQGACLAMEDAVYLAKCLRTQPDLAAALEAYQTERYNRTAPMQKRARLVGRLGQFESRPVNAIRDWVLKTFGTRMARTDEKMWAYEV